MGQASNSTAASPGSPGEREKPAGTWRRRDKPSNSGNIAIKDLGSEKENDLFISPDSTKMRVTIDKINNNNNNDKTKNDKIHTPDMNIVHNIGYNNKKDRDNTA